MSVFVGVGLFIWLTFYFSYHPSSTVLFYGAPIPFMFFQLEGNNWTDFPPPPLIQFFIIITNFFILTAITVIPILIWTFFARKPQTEQGAAANP